MLQDLATAYLRKAAEEHVLHVEFFFDPQYVWHASHACACCLAAGIHACTPLADAPLMAAACRTHLANGVGFDIFMPGLLKAAQVCTQRHGVP